MNITRETIKETLKAIMAEESDYQTFFKKALEKAGKSIPSMSDEEKKKFFNKIDAAWNAKGEKNEGNAFGAAVVAAKEKGEDEFEVGGKTYKVESVKEEETFTATNKETGNVSVFKSKEARDAAVKAGTHSNDKDKGDKKKKGFFSNLFGKAYKDVQDKADARDKDQPSDPKYRDIVMVMFTTPDGTKLDREFKGREEAQAWLDANKEKYPDAKLMRYNSAYKRVPLDESAGCSCGCGTCSESVNEAASDRDFEKVFNIFNKKDYFHLKGSIKTMLGNWQRALDRGDKGAQQYTKQDVIDIVTAQTKARAKQTYDELVKAINKKDINTLKSKLRHDQKFSLAIFTQVTGKKLPKSTRDIHSFLDNEFMNESLVEGRAFINAARKAKEEGKTEFEFNGKTYPVTLKEEAINERRLGKVDLLRSVEAGETSRVEGVKISKDLAFELRMFLQRPLLARTRTGIAIDNAQMKDAIPMLAKVGVHKRLSSGVKKEFADLLKKYK